MLYNTDTILTFSKDEGEVKFIRFLFKYGYLGIAVVIFFIIFDDTISKSFDSWPFIIIFISCVICAHLSLVKFLRRLDLNMSDKKIVFYSYLNDKRVAVNFSDVNSIEIGFYIKFDCINVTKRFNEARNIALIKLLEENFVVQKNPSFKIMKFFDK